MPVFVYEARDQEGQIRKDQLEAPNIRAAQKIVQQDMKMTIVKMEQRSGSAADGDILGWLQNMKKVDEQALTVFSRQFATMSP